MVVVMVHSLLAALPAQLQLGGNQGVLLTAGSSGACFNIATLHPAETCQHLHSACCPWCVAGASVASHVASVRIMLLMSCCCVYCCAAMHAAGDPSTPRSMRSRSNSGGSTGGGPLVAHSISMASTTSLPTPFEGAGHTLSHPLSSNSGGRQHWSAQGGGSVGGLRDLLPSMQDELSAGLTSMGSDGEAVTNAPSFLEASKRFEAARDSTRQQQQAKQQQQQQETAGGAAAGAAGAQEGSGQHELVRLLFSQYNPTSTNYTGLDVDVVLRLSTLVFYCNRPTVAALMVFGTDLGAVNTLLAAPDDDTQVLV